MRFYGLIPILMLALASPVWAVAEDPAPQISKLEFQGVHFGDFPSVDMICVRGLCPVGAMGVGISTNSRVPPAYNQEKAITHYHGVKISTPEYSYFEDKMFMIRFSLECKLQSALECVAAVKAGLDAEYGLIRVGEDDDENRTDFNELEEFVTESGSLVAIVQNRERSGQAVAGVRIFDRVLMDRLRKFYNPAYVPSKLEILDSHKAADPKKNLVPEGSK